MLESPFRALWELSLHLQQFHCLVSQGVNICCFTAKYRDVFLHGGLVVSGSYVYISECFDNVSINCV